MLARAILATICLLLTACATRQTAPGVYRLIRTGPAPVLIPPGVADPSLTTRTFNFPLEKPAPSTCRTRNEVFRVDHRRGYLRLTVQRDALLAHTPQWLADWTAGLEQLGCIPSGTGARFVEQIVQSVPMNPADANRLLHPASATSDYLDLWPGYRLKLVSPILREGAPPGASAIAIDNVSGNDHQLSVTARTSSDFLGYEVSWYEVGTNGKLAFASAESHIGAQVTITPAPRVNHFVFPDTAVCFRLFYLTRVSQADHNIAVLAAATRADLNRQSPAFLTDPDACSKAPPQTCAALHKEIGITPYVAIMANGDVLNVALGSTIADALRTAGVGQPATVLPSLTVRRNYHGTLTPVEFDRTQPDILSLKLLGHEDLHW